MCFFILVCGTHLGPHGPHGLHGPYGWPRPWLAMALASQFSVIGWPFLATLALPGRLGKADQAGLARLAMASHGME